MLPGHLVPQIQKFVPHTWISAVGRASCSWPEDTGENSVLTVLCDGLVRLNGKIVYCTAVLKLFIFVLV